MLCDDQLGYWFLIDPVISRIKSPDSGNAPWILGFFFIFENFGFYLFITVFCFFFLLFWKVFGFLFSIFFIFILLMFVILVLLLPFHCLCLFFSVFISVFHFVFKIFNSLLFLALSSSIFLFFIFPFIFFPSSTSFEVPRNEGRRKKTRGEGRQQDG